MKQLIVAIVLLTSTYAFAQDFIQYTGPTASLADRWKWAQQQMQTHSKGSGVWIGYSIQTMIPEREHILSGSHFTGRIYIPGRQLTLADLIAGKRITPLHQAESDDESVRQAAQDQLADLNHTKKESKLVSKEIAILFETNSSGQLIDVAIHDVTFPFDLDKKSAIFWIGKAEQLDSLQLVQQQYAAARTKDFRDDLISAIGLHKESQPTLGILQKIMQDKNEPEEIRGDAAYYIGELDRPEALSVLKGAVDSDPSSEVREDVTDAIASIHSPEAQQLLFQLAKSAKNKNVRVEAIDFVGKNKTDEAAVLLEDILFHDSDLEVQEEALDALTKMPGAVKRLTRIAETHSRSEIRSDALDELSSEGGDEAIPVLEQIAWKDQDEDLRESAMDALADAPHGKGIPALIKIAQSHPLVHVRKMAVDYLGDSDDPRAKEALVKLLDQ
jgi:HEAT repeat protein